MKFHPSSRRLRIARGVLSVVGVAVVGLGIWGAAAAPPVGRSDGSPSAPSPSPTRAEPEDVTDLHLIGHARTDKVVAHASPSTHSEIIAKFDRLNDQGAPQVFLLQPVYRDPDGSLPAGTRWVKALLPLRPNGTAGYLQVSDLDVFSTRYRIEIDRANFSLSLFEAEREIMSVPVGIGTGETPTPVGSFYLASLLKPPDPDTIYGTYAYGLSGYSETLLDWEDGGIIGLHGTNRPESIGRAASHGCIRMSNEAIEKLVPLLPLGTPIDIV
ncbi:MAG: L,D-transpeptidase [Actinomycetota bacterium]